jgi:hypothetical protein
VLRKRFVTPIINPNYDFDQLMKDMAMEKIDEDGEDEEEGL